MTDIRRCEHTAGYYLSCFIAYDAVDSQTNETDNVVEIHKRCRICEDTIGRAFVKLPYSWQFSHYEADGEVEVFPPSELQYDTN